MIRLPTATLSEDFVRIFPEDSALDQNAPDLKERLQRFHDTGDAQELEPLVKPSERPCKFMLRHLRGRVSEELGDLLAPTLGADNITTSTLILMASLSVSDVKEWDGPQLQWRVHKAYKFRILTEESLDLLCTVPGLVPWLGLEALGARQLGKKPLKD